MEAKNLVIGLTFAVLVLTVVLRLWGGSDDVVLDEPGSYRVARHGGSRGDLVGETSRQRSRAAFGRRGARDFRDVESSGDQLAAPGRRPAAAGAGSAVGDEGGSSPASADANPGAPFGSGEAERGGDTFAAGSTASAPAITNVKPAADTEAAKRGEELRGVQLAEAPTPGPDTPKQDPVLSISFDATTHPDQGESAPIVVDGVTADAGGARFGSAAQFALPDRGNASMMAGSINFWVQPEWAGDSAVKSAMVNLSTPNVWENRLHIFKDGAFLRFLICDSTGTETNVGTLITDWKPNDRHMITATWGDGVTTLYIDTRSIGAAEYNGELDIPPSTPLYIGSGQGNVGGAGAKISNFQIYNRRIGADEIAALFAQTQ
jgi:hypothetical protein